MNNDNGGPAFPVPNPDPQVFTPKTVDELRRLSSGMSLRDWFAGQVLQGAFASDTAESYCLRENFPARAASAYAMADAMLKTRDAK